MRSTKIICTIGPACAEQGILEEMLRAGMNVARMNFSHGDHAMHEKNLTAFRAARERVGVAAALLLDTRGPEIRTQPCVPERQVSTGDVIRFTPAAREEDPTAVAITYPHLAQHVQAGDRILVDDGKLALHVTGVEGIDVLAVAENYGVIKPYKGINLPGVPIDLPFLSERDQADIRFGIRHGVDFIAASFTRTPEDVRALRSFLEKEGGHNIRIIAKIENQEGISHFDEILREADAIMVARGDMGVEVPVEQLPGIQKTMIRRCREAGKPSITATQMMESMVSNRTPTRAEVSDVANAVFDGTSVVMLSGETAAGKYPVEAVRTMARVLERAEQDRPADGGEMVHDRHSITTAICDAACATARDLGASAILVVTRGGITARACSAFRPRIPILAMTPEEKTYHQLSLSHGVVPLHSDYQDSTDELFTHAVSIAKESGYVHPGDYVVLTAGLPIGQSGSTNVIKVEKV